MQATNPITHQIIIKLTNSNTDKIQYTKLLKRTLQQKTAANPVVTIDLTGVHSLTKQQVSVLIYYKQYAEKNGFSLLLDGVSPTLNAFFSLIRLDNFFAKSVSVAF